MVQFKVGKSYRLIGYDAVVTIFSVSPNGTPVGQFRDGQIAIMYSYKQNDYEEYIKPIEVGDKVQWGGRANTWTVIRILSETHEAVVVMGTHKRDIEYSANDGAIIGCALQKLELLIPIDD